MTWDLIATSRKEGPMAWTVLRVEGVGPEEAWKRRMGPWQMRAAEWRTEGERTAWRRRVENGGGERWVRVYEGEQRVLFVGGVVAAGDKVS